MKYNIVYLEEMAGVPNIGMLIEQIDRAALLATEEMRRYGQTLPSVVPGDTTTPAPNRVPLQSEVDTYLRFLVSDAFEGWLEAKKESRNGPVVFQHIGGGNYDEIAQSAPDWEIEGVPENVDPLFDVVVTGLAGSLPGFLTVRISRRLTG